MTNVFSFYQFSSTLIFHYNLFSVFLLCWFLLLCAFYICFYISIYHLFLYCRIMYTSWFLSVSCWMFRFILFDDEIVCFRFLRLSVFFSIFYFHQLFVWHKYMNHFACFVLHFISTMYHVHVYLYITNYVSRCVREWKVSLKLECFEWVLYCVK